ncbi:aminopeptidase Y [Melanomma pulvis-pyrius CBS 109.77]|uniref:Peptide hydrolase n=1 Tax=Melanomma pulvis-pyrius CBS 109.77 TaxID=1314802 RepID=A0A6A6XN93_9PLEO|nr:aminopeptidase Y [Melanomma pulvis-pyrius CBS 109.77]
MRTQKASLAGLILCLAKPVICALPELSSEALQADILSENLLADLVKFNDIATANGGNRAFGLPGYTASVDFIWSRISQLEGVKAWKQDFSAVYGRSSVVNLTAGGTEYAAWPITYSPETSHEGLEAELVLGPLGTAACNISSYDDLDVAGKIVLVESGTCPDTRRGFLEARMIPAAAAGASAVIIYNDIDLILRAGSFSRASASDVPTGFINRVEGLDIKARLEGGESIVAMFVTYDVLDTRVTQNIFVETEGGDPTKTVMFGAHLDSVTVGPGINDNASGSSLLLEIFTALTKYSAKNRIRFAWWGAEEKGLLGSRYYTNSLTQADADDILAYVNFDMVSRGYYGVFDGDGSSFGIIAPPGSAAIEALFVDDFVSKGITVTPASFSNGTDYRYFWETLKKPVGGLFTGTGGAQDPCYHQACDTVSGVNVTQLTINTKAAAHVLSILATKGTHRATTVTLECLRQESYGRPSAIEVAQCGEKALI